MVAPSRTLKYPESEIGYFSFSSPIGPGMKIMIFKLTLVFICIDDLTRSFYGSGGT